VGYELSSRLLETAVRGLQKMPPAEPPPVNIDRLRQAAAKKNRVVRVVDQTTAVLRLHADTLADPHKLLASVRSLFELG
jgi:hypothetical protein